MELSLTSRLKRGVPLVQTARKPEGTAAAVPQKAQEQSDRVSISKEAVARLEEQNRRVMEQIQRAAENRTQEGTESMSGGADLDGLGEAMKTMEKCHKIAARIMRGDKVPPEDEQYLMKNDPTGFKLAMAARRPKKKPKKWKSVLEDKDRNGASTESAKISETEAAPLEAASGESGGAEEE